MKYKRTKKIYAMKEMSKAKIFMKKSVNSILKEREFLEKLHYPFLSNMHFAFQTQDFLYIVLDYLQGGDLRYNICKKVNYTEEEVKFIISNIILSLEYIHSNNIIHRDIKPENLVFDINGYLHLTDFGIANEHYENDILINSSGTPSYMAPEVLIKKPHSFEVDFYALGIIIFELIYGKRPYNGRNRKEIRDQVISRETQIKYDNLPSGWDINCIDFINGLLKRKNKIRLGFKGIYQIKNHPFLNSVLWDDIEKMTFKSPFIFKSNEDNFDFAYANKKDDDINEFLKNEYINLVNESHVYDYFYYNEGITKNKNGKLNQFNVDNYQRINSLNLNKDNNINQSFENKNNKNKENNMNLNFGKRYSVDARNDNLGNKSIYYHKKNVAGFLNNRNFLEEDKTDVNVNMGSPVILKMSDRLNKIE